MDNFKKNLFISETLGRSIRKSERSFCYLFNDNSDLIYEYM